MERAMGLEPSTFSLGSGAEESMRDRTQEGESVQPSCSNDVASDEDDGWNLW